MLIGLGSRVLMSSVEQIDTVDQLFPYVFNSEFPIYISGIILISIMAAAISTANSQLLVVSSSFVYDILGILSKTERSNENLIFISRFVIFLAGSVSLFLAISPPESLLIYGGYVWGVFSVAFLVPLYGGLFFKRATKKGAFLSMLSGLFVMACFVAFEHGGNEIFRINPAMYGVIASIVVFFGMIWVEGDGDNEVDN